MERAKVLRETSRCTRMCGVPGARPPIVVVVASVVLSLESKHVLPIVYGAPPRDRGPTKIGGAATLLLIFCWNLLRV